MIKRLSTPALLALFVLGACAIAYVSVNPAHADDHKAPMSNFTGCHVGAHVGYGAGNLEMSEDADSITFGSSGAMFGVQGGCDYALERFVIGMFAEYNWFDADTTNTVGRDTVKVGLDTKWTVGARAGVLLNPNSLLYAKIGYTEGDGYERITGVDVGGGLELALAKNVFLQADYTYTMWNDREMEDISIDSSQHVARIGVLYRFNGPTVLSE